MNMRLINCLLILKVRIYTTPVHRILVGIKRKITKLQERQAWNHVYTDIINV